MVNRGRRRAFVIEERAKVFVVRGFRAADVLRSAGYKPLWSVTAQGWVLDVKHLPDVVALLEWRNIDVRIVRDAA
jgi:hypothetical protein